MAKIPKIRNAHDAETRNIINKAIDYLNDQGYTYEQLLNNANEILKVAENVNEVNEDTKKRLDNIIADSGTSSTEVVDARGGHTVLSNRLNKFDNTIDGENNSTSLEKGIITFTLDNSYMSTYTRVFPEFKNRGLKFAISPVASNFAHSGISSAHYDYEQLKEMANYGVEVIAHGFDGLDLRKAGVPQANAEYEIVESKKYWQKLGFKVSGYCGYSSLVHSDYKQYLKVFDYAFSDYWTERTIENSVVDENSDIYSMGRHNIHYDYNNGGIQGIKDMIDYVEQNKVSLHYYNHEIGTGTGDSVPLHVLQQILDYASSKNIDILLPSEAIQQLSTKLIATENVRKIRSEMDGHINVTHDNLFSNSAYQGGATTPQKWGDIDSTVGGVTKSLMEYNKYSALKYTFDSTDNTGKAIGLSQRIYIQSDNRPDIVTLSVEVDSDTTKADIVLNLAVQNSSLGNVAYNSKTLTLSKGKKVYEVSTLIPKNSSHSIAANFHFTPQSSDSMTIIHSKPKLERSRSRTPWFAPIEAIEKEDNTSTDEIEVIRFTDNNSTPDINGISYATLSNTSATTITDFVFDGRDHEITFIFTNSNTTLVGSGLIRLKDGQDFSGNSGDVLTLIKASGFAGAWYEKSRSKRTV